MLEEQLLLLGAGAVIGFLIRSAFANPTRTERAEGHLEGFKDGVSTGAAILVMADNHKPKQPEKPVDIDTPAFQRKAKTASKVGAQ